MKVQPVLGVLTIGQSPREDVIPAITDILEGVDIAEAGALDELSREEIEELAPSGEEHVLVTRLRTGEEVQVGKKKLMPHLQSKLDEYARRNVDTVLLLCTGGFPRLNFDGLLLEPAPIFRSAVRGVAGDRRVGVLVPAEEQQVELQAMWRSAGVDAVTACASPYSAESEVAPAVERLIAGGAELLVMDCMGYRPKLKQTIREKSDLPVMLANTTVARIAAEVLGC